MAYTIDGKYKIPDGLPVDLCIFTVKSIPDPDPAKTLPLYDLQVLLIKRGKQAAEQPGKWAFPGGFSTEEETFQESALRELMEETNIQDVHIEQLGAYNRVARTTEERVDKRGWIPTVVHIALVPEYKFSAMRAGDDASDVGLFSIKEALSMDLAFDHQTILMDALERIRRKTMTTPVVKELLPKEFTLSELLGTLQAIVPDFKVANTNFINKLTGTKKRKGILEEVLDENQQPKKTNRNSKPYAKLYRFTSVELRISIYNSSIF